MHSVLSAEEENRFQYIGFQLSLFSTEGSHGTIYFMAIPPLRSLDIYPTDSRMRRHVNTLAVIAEPA